MKMASFPRPYYIVSYYYTSIYVLTGFHVGQSAVETWASARCPERPVHGVGAMLAAHFVVVGTHALYAYESACGVRVQGDAKSDAIATQDIDLLLDTRKYLSFVTTMDRLDTSLLSVFQKVDKTFQLRSKQLYTAVNADGFEIDVVRRAAKDGDLHPLRVSRHDEDFWAVQISTGSTLLDGGHFEQAVVATSGHMAVMRVPTPAIFIRVKEKLAAMQEMQKRIGCRA